MYAKRFYWLPLILIWLLAGCGDDPPPASPPPTALIATAVVQPTPTLVTPLPPTITPTPTATPLPTATPTPTATPPLSARQTLADQALANGDFTAAAVHLEALLTATPAATVTLTATAPVTVTVTATAGGLGIAGQPTAEPPDVGALFNLALAYFNAGDRDAAAVRFAEVLALAPERAEAAFFIGRIAQEQADCARAVPAYQTYLDANPDMAPYVQPRIAACHLAGGNVDAAYRALDAAQAADAHFLTRYENRLALANLYRDNGRYADAAAMYTVIRDAAFTTNTRGEMTYAIGNARELAGQTDAAYAAYRQAVADFPTVYTTYQALIKLLDAGFPVDDFRRGLIDYHAAAYQPAVDAFLRVIEQAPDTYRADTHLYLAWSYEGLGNINAAVAQLDTYAALSVTTAPEGLLEKAELLRRQSRTTEAQLVYRELFETIPQDERAPYAGFQAARLAEWLGQNDVALTLYRDVADTFPDEAQTSEALFRAGWLAYRAGDRGLAAALWQRSAESAPTAEFGLASQLWLARLDPADPFAPGRNPEDNSYYALRLHDVLSGTLPFASPPALLLDNAAVTDQDSAESWLRDRLGLPADTPLAPLDGAIAADPLRVRGEKLWRLGLFTQAKRELEFLRNLYTDDAVAAYQLALYFRDIGLYQPSILAANDLMRLTGTNGLTAPPFIAALAYPVYYADLVVPQATRYGFDPLLQFALIRQESLYETFAASSAAAQGLSQIIPATGDYIAGKLGRTGFQVSDLQRPVVNVPFGAFYLAEQLTLFGGDIHAALAAYNAGPGNALRWHGVAGGDIDLFVETINFAETRLYVQNIYRWYTVYRQLYGATPAGQ